MAYNKFAETMMPGTLNFHIQGTGLMSPNPLKS
jgi:hypothetical protein